MTHRVMDVHFAPKSNDGAMTCSCSWTGQASEFTAHRRANGLKQASIRGDGSPNVWNRKSYKVG